MVRISVCECHLDSKIISVSHDNAIYLCYIMQYLVHLHSRFIPNRYGIKENRPEKVKITNVIYSEKVGYVVVTL